MGDLTLGLAQYFAFYNGERPHQSLGNRTPHEVYVSGQGGGAKIMDKFGGEREQSPAQRSGAGDCARADTGQRCSVAGEVMDAA